MTYNELEIAESNFLSQERKCMYRYHILIYLLNLWIEFPYYISVCYVSVNVHLCISNLTFILYSWSWLLKRSLEKLQNLPMMRCVSLLTDNNFLGFTKYLRGSDACRKNNYWFVTSYIKFSQIELIPSSISTQFFSFSNICWLSTGYHGWTLTYSAAHL